MYDIEEEGEYGHDISELIEKVFADVTITGSYFDPVQSENIELGLGNVKWTGQTEGTITLDLSQLDISSFSKHLTDQKSFEDENRLLPSHGASDRLKGMLETIALAKRLTQDGDKTHAAGLTRAAAQPDDK